MKTDDLIHDLTADLKPAPAAFFAVRGALFVAGTLAVCALALTLLPLRPGLAELLHEKLYFGETVLWLAASLLGAWLTYESAVPGLWRGARQIPALAALGLLVVVLLARMSHAGLGAEFLGEFRLERGWCGPWILISSALEGTMLFLLARQGAPTRPRVTAFWAACSAACLGTFLMQFICFRDNTMHVFVWHFGAIALVVAAGVAAGKKALRW